MSDPPTSERGSEQTVTNSENVDIVNDSGSEIATHSIYGVRPIIDPSEEMRDDVTRMLATLQSRNVLHAEIGSEICRSVFDSLRGLRDALAETVGQLRTRGSHDVKPAVQFMLTAVQTYLAVAWAEYGSPEELPNIQHRKEYVATAERLPDYRVTCILVERGLRGHGLAAIALRGAAGDNAAMESSFALLQKNVLDRRTWSTRDELRIATVTWIERTYRRRRRQHAPLGRLTPIEYEAIMTTPARQAA